MEPVFICPRCGSDEIRYIGQIKDNLYCRRCIKFVGEEADEQIDKEPVEAVLDINYQLSENQKRISDQVIFNYKKGINTMIHAVTGAGKTEIVFHLIEYALNKGHRVGFAIPRKDVVIELTKRFKNSFKNIQIVAVYGGHHNRIEGDLIILTTHQIFRYSNYFDLLVFDEIDAFPYKNNFVLRSFVKRSVRGNYVLMSATLTEEETKTNDDYQLIHLYSRYHGHPLPIPKIVIRYWYFKHDYIISMIKKYQKQKKPLLIFVPTIAVGESLYKIVHIFTKNGEFVHSKKKERNDLIQGFRDHKYDYLITTSVLERGVTIKHLQVIIYQADHDLFTSQSLVQISGRVGRKHDAPDGDVIFLSSRKTEQITKAIYDIKSANQHL
jgi:competence protein ComFA